MHEYSITYVTRVMLLKTEVIRAETEKQALKILMNNFEPKQIYRIVKDVTAEALDAYGRSTD